jgi:hypothetical protein
MNKKAESMALRMVIVGIILIIILAVVLIIFGRGIGQQRDYLNRTSTDVTNCDIGKDCTFIDQITGRTQRNSPGIQIPEKQSEIRYET